MSCQTLERTKKEEETVSAPKMSECQLIAPWNSLGPTVIDQDTPVQKLDLNLKGKLGKFGISEHLLRMKILEGDLGQKYSQLFWGLPSLHSESIVATLLVLPMNSYSLEPPLMLFNGVNRAVTAPGLDQGSPAFPQPLTLSLPFIQPQPFPNTEPQAQTRPFTQVYPQVHVGSPHMQSPSLPCGSTLQMLPQSKTVSGTLNGNEHLQCYLLQNQDNLWSLVPGCQQYATPIGLLVPRFPTVSQPSQNYVSAPRTGHFQFGSELQNNLEPYRPNNPIPPWCYQPCDQTGVGEVMVPRYKPTEASPCSCKCAKPQRTVHWDQSCSVPRPGESSHSANFCERVSMAPQLTNNVAKNLGHILGKFPLGSPQMIPGCYVLNNLRVVPETEMEWACHSGIGLEDEQFRISRKSLDQRQARSILRLHVGRKLWQIAMGRIPITVCCSWLAADVPVWNSSLGNIYCNTAIPRIPFLDHKTQKMLETHLIRYRVSQKWGLPIKVTESIKFYMLREAKTWPLPQSDFPSSSSSTSGTDLKSSFPHPLRENSNLAHEDKMGTANSASVTDHLSLSISRADEGGQGKPHSSSGYEATEKIQTAEGHRPSNDNMSQNDAELQIRPRQEQPVKEQVAGSKSQNEMASSSSHREVPGGRQSREKHPSHMLITPDMLCEILRAREGSGVLSGSGPSSKRKEDRRESVSVVATEQHNPSRMSSAEDRTELKLKLENQSQSQSGGYESDVSFTSNTLTGYSPSSSNSVSSVDISVFRDLHPHLCNRGISLDTYPEPRVFRHHTRDLTPAEKRLASPVPGKEHDRCETPSLETSKAGEKEQPIKREPDKKPHPPESYFRKKIGQFFQWLYPSKDNTRQRAEKDRALFMSCGPPEAHELMASLGKLLEDKLLCGRKSGFLEWSQKCLQAQPEPRGQPAHYGATYAQHGEGKSNCYCPHTAIVPGPSHMLSSGQRHPHVSFKQQPQFWSYLPSSKSRNP
ncbi:1700014D04Rik [Phodopus roborovskii]|uniref:1700014D04Rik protein n=1 Tax=Phodopus roborovskii TaxID=109678 RepID=A0AAU9ZPH8_PHORO|nr:1700014D04Rik [Phodopus roborovskii]